MSTPMAAKQFLSVEDNEGENKLRLDEEVVDSILLSNDVADKPVVVISVAGAYRTGKSFLLDSMCRYLMASGKSNWLDNKSESFDWQGGCEAHTNGMFMSQTIPVTLKSGEKAVVLLMDSQGIFDDNSSTTDSTRVFALSTLLSSVLVYNVMNNLKTDDLVNLRLFTEYGRMAKDNTEVKPFQDLVFLIRDWCHTNNYPVGSKGGHDLVEKRLSSNKESLAQGPAPIKTCFTDVRGFLLPHPGKKVASPNFTGEAGDMDQEFREALKQLVSTLLSPENLTVKMNGDRPMTCRQLVTHIKAYTELFQSGELPGAENIFKAVAEAGNMAAVTEEHNTYMKGMDGLLGQDSPMLQESRLFTQHRRAKDDARNSLKLRKTLRDPSREENYYQSLLEEKIEDWFNAAHKKKLDRDIPEAKKANQKLVNELIDSAKKRTNTVLQDPLRCVPSSEAKICDEHEKVKRETLADFNARKLEVGSYAAEESQLILEQALGDNLCEALKTNEIVKAAHKKKMDRDISAAKNANQKLVEECIQVAQMRMEKSSLWLVPIGEAEICNEHEKTEQELLKRFNEKKVTIGSYDAEEHRKMLELALGGYLREALQKNDALKVAHQIVLTRGISEARKSNQKLVEECINIAQRSTEKDSLNIWRYLPMKEATVTDEHEKAKQKALQHWDEEKVTVDSYNADDAYNADEFRQQLDEALGKHKNEALEENKGKFQTFISSIPGVAVSSGVVCFAVGSAVVTGGTSILVGVAGVAAGAAVSGISKAVLKFSSRNKTYMSSRSKQHEDAGDGDDSTESTALTAQQRSASS